MNAVLPEDYLNETVALVSVNTQLSMLTVIDGDNTVQDESRLNFPGDTS
jgi:hypothetical protein